MVNMTKEQWLLLKYNSNRFLDEAPQDLKLLINHFLTNMLIAIEEKIDKEGLNTTNKEPTMEKNHPELQKEGEKND